MTLDLLQYQGKGPFTVRLRNGSTISVAVPINPPDPTGRYTVIPLQPANSEEANMDWTRTGKFNFLNTSADSLDIVEVLEPPIPQLPQLTIQEKAQIMLDHAQGKPVQILTNEGQYQLDQNPTWNWQEHVWRTWQPKHGEAILCSDYPDEVTHVRVFKEMVGDEFGCYDTLYYESTFPYAKPFTGTQP